MTRHNNFIVLFLFLYQSRKLCESISHYKFSSSGTTILTIEIVILILYQNRRLSDSAFVMTEQRTLGSIHFETEVVMTSCFSISCEQCRILLFSMTTSVQCIMHFRFIYLSFTMYADVEVLRRRGQKKRHNNNTQWRRRPGTLFVASLALRFRSRGNNRSFHPSSFFFSLLLLL